MKNSNQIQITPVSFEEFQEKFTPDQLPESTLVEEMQHHLQIISSQSFSNFFWFITSAKLAVLACSDNLHELTPYKKNEWKKHYPNFLEKIMLKKDFSCLLYTSPSPRD